MPDLFANVVVPVAGEADARATVGALSPLLDPDDEVTLVHVVEKAGGGIDKASVEQRELDAADAFAAAREGLDRPVDTEIAYGTDVAGSVFDVAADVGATSVAFTPRGGSRLVQLVTGDVALSLVTENDVPVVSLPAEEP